MEIKCELCGEMVVVGEDLVPGQHVRCPFCGGKFSYAERPGEITEEDLREAIAICRKDDEWNKYYKNAPAGAKLYIAMVFYGKVFASTLDKAAFVEAFKGIGPELKERDLRYLLQHEDDEAMREYLSDRLASACGGMGEAGECALAVKPSQSLSAGGTAVSRRIAKPAKVLRTRNGSILDASCRMNSQSQTNWTGVVAAVVVALAVVCAGIFLYRVWAECQEVKERARTEEVARIKALEDKRKQLNDCVNNARSEVESLQKKLALAVTVVDDDKARFKNEMTRIETENNLRAGSARTNGRMRFNAAELAMAIFKSPIFGGIYERYMEQSLAGKAAEAKVRILAEIGGRSTFSQDEVDGIDVIGNAYVKSANKEILNAMDAGRRKVAALKEEVRKLQSVVRDAEDVAKGTDLKQMNDAKARMEELKCSELAKKLDRFVVVMREMSIVKMPEDEFVVREETNMVANISREGISATSVPETEPENTAENSLPQSKEKESEVARISAPKQKSVAKPKKTVAEITAEHTLTGNQSELVRILEDTKTPYTVTGEYFVDTGTELIIKQGVTLVFAKNAGLTVQGAIRMEGTVESPIVCKGVSSGIGVWLGITICSKATAEIEGISVSGAKVGLNLGEKVDIRKCSICKNEIGIISDGNTLEDLYICENRGDAIHVGHPTLDHCTVSYNGGNGLCGWGGCDITGSVIFKNKKAGIDCWNGGHEVTVNGSYISENKKFDIHNGCGTTWDCTGNYWGPAVTKLLEQKGESVNLPRIYDRKDKPDTGMVNVSKWLKEMPKDCGAREYPGMKPKK